MLVQLTYHTRDMFYNPVNSSHHLQLFHLSMALEVLRVTLGIELQIHALILATKKVDARCPVGVRRLARLPQEETPHLHSQPPLRLGGFPYSLI